MSLSSSDRLDLPFVGPVSFGKSPLCLDLATLDADVAVLGVPNDMGTQYRSGCRFGPRAIREASTVFALGHQGMYLHEDDRIYLAPEHVRIADVGDVDIIHTDMERSRANTTRAVREILKAKAMPVILGGDHAVSEAVVAAFTDLGPLHIIQIDAHLDFVDERCGVRHGHGSPMRRIAEMPHVSGLTQLGIRNVSSSSPRDYEAARAAGSRILSVRQCRELGLPAVLDLIPDNARYYITFDIDGLDPSIAPGTGMPSGGGFTYYEALDLFKGLATKGDVLGIDLVEVCPAYDPTGITAFHAAQILLTALGYIFYERAMRTQTAKF